MAWTRTFRRVLRTAVAVLATAGLLLLVLVAFLPHILPLLPMPEIKLDLSDRLTPQQQVLFSNKTIRIRCEFFKDDCHDLAVKAAGTALDWPFTFEAKANYSLLKLRAYAMFSAALDGSVWTINGNFKGRASEGWVANATLPDTTFSEQDPVLGALAARLTPPTITNLTFGGQVRLNLQAATTNSLPLPTWKLNGRLTDFNASLTADGTDISLERLRANIGVDGLGPLSKIRPLHPLAESITIGDIALSNAYASVHADDTRVLVSEASADVFGGKLRLYSLYLDSERMSGGVTLFIDEVEAGAVLSQFKAFRGNATGRLHGKIPLRIRRGEHISFSNGFLYSAPGEIGKVELTDTTAIRNNLVDSGVSEAMTDNLDKALRNLSYSALRLQLHREDDRTYALSFKLDGTAKSGNTEVPVCFAVTLHGDLEQLLNTGLKAAQGK